MSDKLLSITGLSAGYGPLRVLHEIDFSVAAGERPRQRGDPGITQPLDRPQLRRRGSHHWAEPAEPGQQIARDRFGVAPGCRTPVHARSAAAFTAARAGKPSNIR